MQQARDLIFLFLPEIILSVTAVVIIIFSLINFLKSWSYYAAIAGLILHFLPNENVFAAVMAGATLITVLLSGRHQRSEHYFFILTLLIGAEVLVESNNFITIILAFETISISSYLLTSGLNPEKNRAEAAWKFFIYGAVTTAIMIFGMTYWYGSTGTLSFEKADVHSYLATFGIVMIFSGLSFKATASPFHLWAPDVYQATPAPIVAYFSFVPKIAALAVIIKLSQAAGYHEFVGVIAILSLIVGTLAALSQTDAKRMMAYSSVAQAGIMLAAISVNALDVLLFYILVFAVMNYAVFIFIGTREKTAFVDFSGMGYTHPLAAVAGTLALVSLVGLPPVAGFMGKLFVFTGVWKAYDSGQSIVFLILFIIGLLATIASLYFYLKIPFYAFLRRPEGNSTTKIPFLTNLLLVILVVILLALFIAPGLVDGMGY